MATVRVEPAGIELDVRAGESLIEAAWRLGYVWPTNCYGQAECMACAVRVVDGESSIESAGAEELSAMKTRMPKKLRAPATRLACCLTVTGEGLVVEKKGVRKSVSDDASATAQRFNR
jgi:2Fe-2S ferredoxin